MEKEQIKTGIIVLLGIVVILGMIFGTTITGRTIENYSQENYLLKTILKADKDYVKISIDRQIANQYYDEAGFAYEDGDYNSVERDCRLAREYYAEESQGYRKIKAELKEKEIEDKLIYIYIDILDASIEMANNMFEACEYLETAARYYDMNDYDMGGSEIGGMNEKIISHDKAVEEYNNLLEEFRVELEKRI